MLDQGTQELTLDTTQRTRQHFDLVVVGAGIAGLNALFSAAQYHPRSARALLLDEKPAPGGMWNVVYDYVRLHQPHPMFTVGELRWDWTKPQDYLAKRDEVQRHLGRSLSAVRDRIGLTEGFGMSVSEINEVATPEGFRAEVTYHPVGAPDEPITVTAGQVIYAVGFDYQSPVPLSLSASDVVSTVPVELKEALAAHPGAPVYVIGGGKTGMDTIIAVLDEGQGRPITLLKGTGTSFFNRTRYLPKGLAKWTQGAPLSRVFHDIAMHFDGHNEEDTRRHFRKTYATDPETQSAQFLYGLLSEDELARIDAGLTETLSDYLEDVIDTPAGPCMRLRSGAERRIPAGSIVVNCMGNIFRGKEMAAVRPIVSPHGKILSVTPRDAMHFLTSVGGFFLPHLHYRGKLRGTGLYTIDNEDLFRKDRNVWVAATSTQAYVNQAICVQNLPLMLLDKCGLDFDRWFPFPRRMLALMKMKTGAARDLPRFRASLDAVAARFDVQCAPLE